MGKQKAKPVKPDAPKVKPRPETKNDTDDNKSGYGIIPDRDLKKNLGCG